MVDRKDFQVESLLRHLEFIPILRDRNLNWAMKTDDTEVARTHKSVADLFDQILQEYNQLLDRYNQPPNDANKR
jgi:hypothetical protein